MRVKALDVSIDTHARFYRAVDTAMVIALFAAPIMAVRLVVHVWWETVRFRVRHTTRGMA